MRLTCILLIFGFFLFIFPPYSHAQETEQQLEQKESRREERKEQLKPPETAKDIIELLKQRALLKVKEKRRELLTKTRTSAGLLYGYETNVNQDAETKGDFYFEEDLFFNWLPTFNRYLGLDAGYWLINQSYLELTDSSSLDHAVNLTLNLTPFESGKLKLSPGVEYEWLTYPLSKEASYENIKYFIKFKHFVGRKWSYGGSYEYFEKAYDEKKARNQEKKASPDIVREDTRNTVDLYLTRYIGKYSLRVKGRAYINLSNDQYLESYDYTSFKSSVTASRTFLEDDKLYVSFTPSYERKNYHHRTVVTTARFDNIATYAVSAYYTLKKPFTFSYQFTYKNVGSNDSTGRYKDITNVFGLTADF